MCGLIIHQHTELNLLSSNTLYVIVRKMEAKENYIYLRLTNFAYFFPKYITLYHGTTWKLVALATLPACLLLEIKN